MAITGQTLTNSFVVAGQKFYAADFLVLIAELQALNDELVSEAIANAGNQAVGGVKTFSAIPVFSAGANMGSAKVTAVLDPTADQDAATKKYVDDTAVSAALAKAWVSFDSAGTILDSYNVASVSKTSTGVYQITWDTDFADTNYAVVATPEETKIAGPRTGTILAGTVDIWTATHAGSQADSACSVIAFGTQ